MRRLLLPIALLLLLAGTWLLWQHRFQMDPEHPPLDLADLAPVTPPAAGASWQAGSAGAPVLALQAGPPAHPVIQRLPLPGLPPVDFLWFDFKAQAAGLSPGTMPWSDGRLMVEWHPATAGLAMQPEYLGSARENYASEISCLVARSDQGPAVPVLRLEHLGLSGSFRLERCRVAVVQETAWWRHGRWLLLGGWFSWAAAVAGWGRTSGPGRPLLAAAVWLICATQWAIPGPWQAYRPLAPSFAGMPAPSLPAAAVTPASFASPAAPPGPLPVSADPAAVETLGELPFGGSLLLEIKDKIKQARPLFHLLLFFVPAFVLAVLVGRWRTVMLSALLAAGIESSQYLFGYGFDSSDLFDLACDASGVGLALLLHAVLARWLALRKAAPGRVGPPGPTGTVPDGPLHL